MWLGKTRYGFLLTEEELVLVRLSLFRRDTTDAEPDPEEEHEMQMFKGSMGSGLSNQKDSGATPNFRSPAHSRSFDSYAGSQAAFYTSTRKDDDLIPQCPRMAPTNQDASLPDRVLKLPEDIFVQFYHNPSCNHGAPGSGFMDSVKQWSQTLEPAQLWIGAPGSEEGAGPGYVPPADMQK
ncbi:MAG: hypothetical protein MMC23_008004 [Stictis urceolatum]|nr:hypothetical protein [Stictis urceolata]